MTSLSSLPRKRLASAMLLALGLVAACSQRGLPQLQGSVNGAYGLVLVADLVFITSVETNELRVLDLSVPLPRDFVRGPNPLEPLSIPVVNRPVGVVRDVHYDADGAEVGGPYVYAFSSAVPNISVVGADRAILKTLYTVNTNAPVSAITAHGPDAALNLSNSRLFYATAEGNTGKLWRVLLPGADTLTPDFKDPTKALGVPLELLTVNPGEFISALVVMPDGNRVAVATRSQTGQNGRSFIVDTANGNALTELKFPHPVRLLLTNPSAQDIPLGPQGEILPGLSAGDRIYGLMDEESCGSGTICQGLLAVDARTGEISQDIAGGDGANRHTMLPIGGGRALINGVAFARGASVNDNALTGAGERFALLGMATDSSGAIFFFDAYRLRPIDSNPNGPTLSSITLTSPDRTTQTFTADSGVGPQQSQISLAEGSARDEIISLTREGLIPGLVAQPASPANGQSFPTSASTLSSVVPGDVIVLASASNTDCKQELPVTSVVQASGGSPGAVVTTAASILDACASYSSFSVRAGPGTELPYVVVGAVTGYMGRTGARHTFDYPASEAARERAYFYHADDYNPGRPQVHIPMGADDPAVQRDWQYSFTALSGFLQLSFSVDTTYLPDFFLPGALVHVPAQAAVFVAYPSASRILEFSPPLIVPNQPNSRNIEAYP